MNPQDIPALDPETPVILEMSHISKTFGAVTALVDVSIKLRQGEVLALVGDNGAGKSTLIKILSGFHQPDAGTIVSNGKEVFEVCDRINFLHSGEIVLDASTADTTEEELIRIVKSGLGREAIAAAAAEVQRQMTQTEEDSEG